MELVTLDQINAARQRIENTALYTPMLEVPWPRLRQGFGEAGSAKPLSPQPLL